MIPINLPETASTRMELVPEPRAEKNTSLATLETGSWIELSEPASITLQKEPIGDDKELAQFLSANAGRFRYDYVRLGCSFHASSPERLEKAWLYVTLQPQKLAGGDAPISWSIAPLSDYDLKEETTKAEIGADAKILTAKIGSESKIAKKIYSLRGFREGGPNPYWEMISTQASSLEGVFRFHMVVRSLANTLTIGQVRLEAVISNRVFVAFRQKRPFDQNPSQLFRLQPS